jgi:hypothetical protein
MNLFLEKDAFVQTISLGWLCPRKRSEPLFTVKFLNNYHDGVIDVFANPVYQSAGLV